MEQRDNESYTSEFSEENENAELEELISNQDLVDFEDDLIEDFEDQDERIEEEIEEEQQPIEDSNRINNEVPPKEKVTACLETIYKTLRINFFTKFVKLFFK